MERYEVNGLIACLLLFLTIFPCTIAAGDFSFPGIESIDVEVGSYVGNENRQDDVKDKRNHFISEHLFRLGTTLKPVDKVFVTVSAELRDNTFGNDVSFNEFTVKYSGDRWDAAYRYFRLGYGEKSHIFDKNVLDPLFDLPVFECYDFYGLDAGYQWLGLRIGGNDYNSGIVELSAEYGPIRSWLLHVERGNLYNSGMSGAGAEFDKTFDRMRVYGTGMYRYFPEDDQTEETGVIDAMLECEYSIDDNWSMAANWVTRFIDEEKPTWQVNIRAAKWIGRIETAFLGKYYQTPGFIDREYRLTVMGRMTQGWMLGLNMAAIDGSIGGTTYQAGIQTIVELSL